VIHRIIRSNGVTKLLGSRIFAPPFRPLDFMGRARGVYDCPLFGGTECPIEACQRGFDEPRLKGDPRGLAVKIEFLGHSQRFERRCDGPDATPTNTMVLIGDWPARSRCQRMSVLN
jgi:hypothetical protein